MRPCLLSSPWYVQHFYRTCGIVYTGSFIFVYSFFNKSSFNIDSVSIDFRSDKIYVENVVWLEDSHHVDVYQIENAFFVRRIDSYKL